MIEQLVPITPNIDNAEVVRLLNPKIIYGISVYQTEEASGKLWHTWSNKERALQNEQKTLILQQLARIEPATQLHLPEHPYLNGYFIERTNEMFSIKRIARTESPSQKQLMKDYLLLGRLPLSVYETIREITQHFFAPSKPITLDDLRPYTPNS